MRIPVTEFRSQHGITRFGGETQQIRCQRVLSSRDCGEKSTPLCSEPWIPVIETILNMALPRFGGEQADSVPASVEQWGLRKKSIPTCLKPSYQPPDSTDLPNPHPQILPSPNHQIRPTSRILILRSYPHPSIRFDHPPESHHQIRPSTRINTASDDPLIRHFVLPSKSKGLHKGNLGYEQATTRFCWRNVFLPAALQTTVA